MTTTYWSPNQASIAQVETYTFSAPNGVGNTYSATINGKSVTYTSVSGDTAALAATGLFNLLNSPTGGIAAELSEITFANPSSGVVTATAKVPGTPFANVPGTTNGLVLSTGGGLSNGISTAHTQANQSPSDINDPQNWVRVLANGNQSRSLPQNGDDGVLANTSVPMLWNLDQLAAVQFNTLTRWQSMGGSIGLLANNPNGYAEWRAQNFKCSGPQGSTPAGGLVVTLGYSSGTGTGPSHEFYDFGSQPYTMNALASGNPDDEYGIRVLGVHTNNTINALGGVTVGVAMLPGQTATLNSVTCSGATVATGKGVTWATNIFGTAATCTAYGGSLVLNSAPPTLTVTNGTQLTVATDGLTWPTVTAQGGCNLTMLAGGVITTLTMSQSCTLDKSHDNRALTITNSTIDGDTCQVIDPNNCITFTNATTVKQQVTSGPFQFTGTRTVKVV